MLMRIICVTGLISCLVMSLTPDQLAQTFQVTRNCMHKTTRPELCLLSTPALSRRKRFSESLPRRKVDRCSMPCQKRQVPIKVSNLKTHFRRLLGVPKHHSIEFYHENDTHKLSEVTDLGIDMCLGSCRHM